MSERLWVLPADQAAHDPEALGLASFPSDGATAASLFGDADVLALPTARSAIHLLARRFGLGRSDEVLIATTSDSGFVSSCVTCTWFEHCAVSRVLSDRTRLVWIIHEFGFPHPGTSALVETARSLGIPVVEDSAHSLDSFLDGQRLGLTGDFGLYSLPKTLPVAAGGVLIGRDVGELERLAAMAPGENVDDLGPLPTPAAAEGPDLASLLPHVAALSARRRSIHRAYADAFARQPQVYPAGDGVAPFAFVFTTPAAAEVIRHLEGAPDGAETVRTHNEGWVGLPDNPFAPDRRVERVIRLVTEVLG